MTLMVNNKVAHNRAPVVTDGAVRGNEVLIGIPERARDGKRLKKATPLPRKGSTYLPRSL